jgi:hypothetical protein
MLKRREEGRESWEGRRRRGRGRSERNPYSESSEKERKEGREGGRERQTYLLLAGRPEDFVSEIGGLVLLKRQWREDEDEEGGREGGRGGREAEMGGGGESVL